MRPDRRRAFAHGSALPVVVRSPVSAPGLEPALHAGFEPVVDRRCRALVLGSFPGVVSLTAGHYYAHPRNQFWPIMGAALGRDLIALPFDARYRELLAVGIGLWDIIARCDRTGSLDQRIRNARPVELAVLVERLPALRQLLLNGRRAQTDVRRVLASAGIGHLTCIDLPSTSPAHASLDLAAKSAVWQPAIANAMHRDEGIGIEGST